MMNRLFPEQGIHPLLHNPVYLVVQFLAIPHERTCGDDGGGFSEHPYPSAFVLQGGVGFVGGDG